MAQHIVTAPDGVKHIIVAPDTATPEEVVAYAQKTIPQKPKLPDQDPRITELQKPGAAQRALRGVPFLGGALDEIGAGADAALNMVSGGRIGEPYEQGLQRRREAVKQSDAEHPIRNTVDAVLGGVASAQALPFFRPAAGNGTMAAVANGGINATAAAVGSGFTEGEGGFLNRVDNAKSLAAPAALLGMVGGGATQQVINRIGGTPANSITRQADDLGIQIPQFMEGGRASQQIGSKLGAIPFVGDDINGAVMRTRNQLSDAAERISHTMSPNGMLPQQAGEAARNAITTWADDGARAIQHRVYAPVDRAMAQVTVPLSATSRTANALMGEGYQAASDMHSVALREVQDALSRPNGLEFPGLSRLRTQIGVMIDDKVNPMNRTARAGLQRIYGALTEDMETALATNGGAAVQRAWERANGITRQIAERRDVAAKIVGVNGDKAGEGVIDKIVAMASTKSTADAARLGQARRVMGAEAWRDVAENAIARLGRNQSNDFSPDIFVKNYNQLSHEGRRLLFNSTGNDNMLPQLEALADVSRALQRHSRLGNPSGTGGVAALLAALGGAASGDMGATAATALGGRAIGMLMARPAVIRQVTRHAMNMERMLRGRAAQASVAATAAALARVVSKETGEDPKAIELRIMSASPQR